MPHIIVKLYPERTEEQKVRLAEAITKDVVEIAKYPEDVDLRHQSPVCWILNSIIESRFDKILER
jgi:hypothetical protein